MNSIAKVVADIALDREFDYLIPPSLEGKVALGSRVTIPFGRRRTQGYVVGFAGRSDHPNLKSVIGLVDEKPYVDGPMLELVRWAADYYCAPVEQVIRTVLPGAVRRQGARFRQRLFVFPEDSLHAAGSEHGQPLTPKQAAIRDLLLETGGSFLHVLVEALGVSAAPVRAMERKGLLRVGNAPLHRDPLSGRTILPTEALSLTAEQASALKTIDSCIEAIDASAGSGGAASDPAPGPHVVLLYGVTGSGKTEVYLQAIRQVLDRGRGAIVLVPEISLTPQTVERFHGRFGDRVAVLHSHLSEGERHDEWHRIRDGRASIVVGARSAVFAPVHDLGLIVVDEEHEPSYKQEEAPRYNARDMAVMRGSIQRCAVVLGSATPSIESWHNAVGGKYLLATLRNRVDNRRMPVMRVVDMRIETQSRGRAGVLSQDLIEAVRARLDRGEQTILFLNRRGFATSVICPRCGHVAGCDQCSVSYTYHRGDQRLRCHICGQQRSVPKTCPGCGDPAFRFAGFGTQRVENIVSKFFPHARIQRMDADVTTAKDSYDRILGDFRSGRTDILVGTQMIAKGLHFPNVTLVGVIYADLSLHMPDFRAGERTFQLLAQVAGRAGRGEVAGEVIVQTYTPFHMAVQAARRLDYEGMYDQEIEFRRELRYPPFTHLLCVTLRGGAEEKVSFCAGALADRLRQALPASVTVAGPTPAPLAKAKGKYRYQIMLRCGSVRTMTGPLKEALRETRMPKGIACTVDVDAISLL
ncbi:primosomal protein N' [Verrucomicrobiota bacterium]